MLTRSLFRISSRMPKRFYSFSPTDGAIRQAGGAMASREKAAEDKYMREREAEKLAALKEKFRKQQEHLKDLEDHVDDLIKDLNDGKKNE